jgi:hypothetical protein
MSHFGSWHEAESVASSRESVTEGKADMAVPVIFKRINRPALRFCRAQNAAASTASRAYVRDDRDTSLQRGGTARVLDMICVEREEGEILRNRTRQGESKD